MYDTHQLANLWDTFHLWIHFFAGKPKGCHTSSSDIEDHDFRSNIVLSLRSGASNNLGPGASAINYDCPYHDDSSDVTFYFRVFL